MGIRSRTIALVVTTSLVVWIAMAVVAAAYATRTSNENDKRASVAVLDSSAAAVASERDRLVTTFSSWAAWDDAYFFVKHPTDTFIQSNLSDAALDSLNIDFMIFADTTGRIVYAKSIDPTTHRSTSLPAGVVRYLATQPALLHMTSPRAVASGALPLPEGPFLVAALPIGKSDYSAAPDGTLITGFRVGDKVLAKIGKITSRPIGIFSNASASLPADVQSARASLDTPDAHLVRIADSTTIVAYSTVAGIEGEPGVIMRVATPRTAYLESRSTIVWWGLGMTAFGLVAIASLGITLDRTVLRRLDRLSSAVHEVGLATSEKTRMPVSANDEFGILATEINRMLDELDKSHSEMSYLVEHDPLTGLFNRRHFENELQREIDEHERLGAQGAILWFDLDHFKDINDSLGHAAGDELLNAFGRHLQNETRSYCTVARLGGDEFGMLIPHVRGPEAVGAATRLIEGFSSRTFLVGDHDLHVSASAGVVLYPEHGMQTSELLARADIAMYDAKAEGGNKVVAYAIDDVWQNEMTERLKAAERIHSAMREDRLLLYAQPIRGFASGGTRCFELLLRMRDEYGSLVLPADIIPAAERLGIIRDIDRWVARRAIRLLALAQEEDSDVEFSINLSGCAFSDETLVDVIRHEFDETDASPERLIIEITETTTIANIEGAVRFIRTLKEIGCRFSLDDFGSGASSYYYLKHLPVDFLKIDGSLVTGVTTDSADAHFVNAIVEMCRGLQIQTVAEYVESENILDAISQTGVDFVQGYHVGMPEPLDVYLGDRFSESSHGWGAAPEAGASGEGA